MELKSSISRRWKLFLLGCFCGGLLSVLFIDKIDRNGSLSDANNAFLVKLEKVLDSPSSITTSTEPSNLTTRPLIDVLPPTIISPSKSIEATKKVCDMFNGRWVYKADAKPSYNSMTCPFLEVPVSCQKNGRSDFEYENWSWEARECDIPLFDGRVMLERLRNKRMIIVGDSINRNMWESLACLLYSSVPSSRTQSNVKNTAHMIFKAKDYNFTFEFYMIPFLVQLDKKHKSGRRVLILDQISHFSNQWRGANIMVFNSAHWWTHNNIIKSWDMFEYKGKLTEDTARDIAYKRGMRTWASWIKKNVDPKKTTVYFRSVSPTHDSKKNNQWCHNITQPMMKDSYVMGFPQAVIDVIENVIKGLSESRVKYLNITNLSKYRIDAHPSIYTKKIGVNDLPGRPDCSHWCLPGLPDTWNRLLYASILFDTTLEGTPIM